MSPKYTNAKSVTFCRLACISGADENAISASVQLENTSDDQVVFDLRGNGIVSVSPSSSDILPPHSVHRLTLTPAQGFWLREVKGKSKSPSRIQLLSVRVGAKAVVDAPAEFIRLAERVASRQLLTLRIKHCTAGRAPVVLQLPELAGGGISDSKFGVFVFGVVVAYFAFRLGQLTPRNATQLYS